MRYIFFVLICFLFIGVGCKTIYPENVASSDRCRTQPYVAELERVFGVDNLTPTDYFSSDPYRNGDNSCLYFGTVLEDNINYEMTVAVVSDPNQDYFNWEKTEVEVNKTFAPADERPGLPPGSFYKKLAILPEINFGRQRKQEYSWSLVVHINGFTYSVTDVPQFVGVDESEMEEILRAMVNSLIK